VATIAQTSSGPSVARWRDRKRYLWPLGLILPTSLLMAVGVAWLFGKLGWTAATPVLWWIGPILLYVLLPILDTFFGADDQNPPDEVIEYLENDKYYRYCTYAFIPFQMASLVGRRPELAGSRRRFGADLQNRCDGDDGRHRWGRNQHRPRNGPQA
jgi:alkane 1-monooxygenase